MTLEAGHRAFRPPGPTLPRLIVAGAVGYAVARLFSMPFLPDPATSLAGRPLPVGSLFAFGLVALQALRAHHALQQLLRPFVAALFLAFGFPGLLAAIPADVRYLFSLAICGAVVALYEWGMP